MESSAMSSHTGGSSSSSQDVGGLSRHSPVPYRQRPLEYSPPVRCWCTEARMAARWISWSDGNPGRRYLKCQIARGGGCKFFQWYDEETTPFLRQLLVDLRDQVRGLVAEKRNLRDAQTRLEASVFEHREQVKEMKEGATQKDMLILQQELRIHKLEKDRMIFKAAICFAVVMYVVLKAM